MYTVAVVVGSVASGSINRRLAKALEKLAEGKLKFQYVRIDDLPHYDYETTDATPEAKRLKAEVEAADAVLFVTPEYLRSIPGVLKNAIDVGSRPYGHSSWKGKPTAVCGTSGGLGTMAAQQHLRNILSHTGAETMAGPEVFLQNKPGLIDDAYDVTDEGTKKFLSGFVDKFVDWIAPLKK